MIVKKDTPILLWIFTMSVITFYFICIPVFSGESDFRFYADSMFYMDFSEKYEQYLANGYYFIGMGGNLLGPFLIYQVLFGNVILIFLFNLGVYWTFAKLIMGIFNLNRLQFSVFFFISPISYFSLLSVNKEVLVIIALMCFFLFYHKKKISWLLLAFVFSVLARWQLTLVFVIFIVVYSSFNPLRKKPLFQLFILLISISIVYPFVGGKFTAVNEAIISAKQELGGGGVYFFLSDLQSRFFGYIVAFPLKALHLFVGMATNFKFAFRLDDFYITTGLFYQAWLQLIVLLLFLYRILLNRMIVFTPLFSLLVLYLMIFSLSPIYNIRYMYPAYILMLILAFYRKTSSFWLNKC